MSALRIGYLALAFVAFGAQAAAPATIKTYPASDFVDSVGVNMHVRYKDSVYATQFDLLKQHLLAARIRHVRDGALDKTGSFFAEDGADRFAELGRAGIRITYIFRPMVPREFVQGWPARVSPSFEAFELPNELNLSNALPWTETLRIYMPLFRQYVRGSPASASYPIVGPSIADLGNNPQALLGDQSANLDFGNLHKYYRSFNPATDGYGGRGAPPCDAYRYGTLQYALCQTARVSRDKPIICTEAGYAIGTNPAREVTPEIQARYIARMLLLHFKAGIRRTYVYQLADLGTDGGATMGLLDSQGNPRPSFRELSALQNELFDEGKAARPVPLDVSLAGQLDDVESAVFGKSDGSYSVVLWVEKPGMDTKSGAPIAVPEQGVRISLPANYRAGRVTTFDAAGASIVKRITATRVLDLSLTDNLAIVNVAPVGAK